MKIHVKIYAEGVNCSVCGDRVQNLYALHEIENEENGTCGVCLCNHIMHLGYNIESHEDIEVRDRDRILGIACDVLEKSGGK